MLLNSASLRPSLLPRLVLRCFRSVPAPSSALPARPRVAALLFVAMAVPGLCQAQAVREGDAAGDMRYLLGMSYRYGPEYFGARQNGGDIKPLWALRWGRWRIATSGSSGLMGFGRETVDGGAGASRELFRNENFSLGFGLRIDSGRDSRDSESTQGLPDVKRTLRGRVYVSYNLAPGWQLGGSLSQDLAGRDGGLVWSTDLRKQLYRSAGGELSVGIGVSGGNGRYMQSYFGVPEGPAAERLGRSYSPGSGLRDAGLGLSYTRSISKHWVCFSSLGTGRLLGTAADSPLNQKSGSFNWSLGLAYRN